jgi:hypothetical protein
MRRLNLGEAVVDHATELQAFNHAFQLAQLAAKQKLPDVHLKYAMFLEDCGRFQEAEGEFVAAGGQVAGTTGGHPRCKKIRQEGCMPRSDLTLTQT